MDSGKNIPHFEPTSNDIPYFTPPSATRISHTSDGTVCFYHPNEMSSGRCARCGKYICKDCVEAYGVTAGEYAGKCLCYGCCKELVQQNIEELTQNREKIKFQFILSLIGMAIGFVCGLVMGIEAGDFAAGLVAGLLYACVGGVFLSAVKAYFSMLWDAIKIIFSSDSSVGVVAGCIFLMIRAVIIGFQCIFATISNTIFYINYLKKNVRIY